jgi:hypothetical protein
MTPTQGDQATAKLTPHQFAPMLRDQPVMDPRTALRTWAGTVRIALDDRRRMRAYTAEDEE